MLKREANKEREVVIAARLNQDEYRQFKSLLDSEDVLASEGIRRAIKAWRKEILERDHSMLPEPAHTNY